MFKVVPGNTRSTFFLNRAKKACSRRLATHVLCGCWLVGKLSQVCRIHVLYRIYVLTCLTNGLPNVNPALISLSV